MGTACAGGNHGARSSAKGLRDSEPVQSPCAQPGLHGVDKPVQTTHLVEVREAKVPGSICSRAGGQLAEPLARVSEGASEIPLELWGRRSCHAWEVNLPASWYLAGFPVLTVAGGTLSASSLGQLRGGAKSTWRTCAELSAMHRSQRGSFSSVVLLFISQPWRGLQTTLPILH
jgi:hypothetical protein